MDAETRLNKRIEIAARLAGNMADGYGYPLSANEKKLVARQALDLADAIIQTAEEDDEK